MASRGTLVGSNNVKGNVSFAGRSSLHLCQNGNPTTLVVGQALFEIDYRIDYKEWVAFKWAYLPVD
jgi:hypothetical protein